MPRLDVTTEEREAAAANADPTFLALVRAADEIVESATKVRWRDLRASDIEALLQLPLTAIALCVCGFMCGCGSSTANATPPRR